MRLIVLAALLLGGASPAAAGTTPFTERVYESVWAAESWLVGQQAEDGAIGNPSATGLAVLCLLELRTSAELHAPPSGYGGRDAERQEQVRRAVRAMVEADPALWQGAGPRSYETGNRLMALAVYLATGGPADAGGATPVPLAVENGVTALRGTQGHEGCNLGGWNYEAPGQDGDLSTSHFVMNALSAASAVLPGAAATLPDAQGFLSATLTPDGGHRYRGCGEYAASHAMSAVGVWLQRLVGRPLDDAELQFGLRWLHDRYRYDGQENYYTGSFYYYLWALTKALLASPGDPPGDPLGAASFTGLRDPVEDGFPEETPGWWYDVAWLLLQEQREDGSWPSAEREGESRGTDPTADTAFACLTLTRSFGGACPDLDGDGVCETVDVCPGVADPEQADADGDGVGDPCDLCPAAPNSGQRDLDGDGLGDACDTHPDCFPVPETCNGLDDDCNDEVDDLPGEPPLCATGEPGACARGLQRCVEGELVCERDHDGASEEACDTLDNDCDGRIDEGVRNACGRCGRLPAEVCNGRDDDCDGRVDEGSLCPPGQVCVQGGRDGEPAGTCASRCRPGGCDGARVCWDGLCLDPCLKLACAAHEVCNPEARRCEDWCDLIHDCPEGEHCYGGECGRCPAVPCGPGLVCAAAGRCRPDPCEDAPCTAIEACIEGECVASCASRSCPLFTTCVDGACVSDPCGGLTCGPGEGCVDGLCVESRCLGAAGCPDPAHVCIPGVGCRPDPCRGVRCPAAERCEPACPGRECRARCVADWEPGPAAEGEGEGPAEGEGEGPAPEGCAAGTLRSCRCDDGRAGLQECDEAGFGWAPCACADLPAPGPGPAEDESPAEDGCDCALTPPRAGSTLPLPLLLRR